MKRLKNKIAVITVRDLDLERTIAIQMIKTEALIYATNYIKANSVHPGFIWTPMVENHLKILEGEFEENKKLVRYIPIVTREPDDI
ncbi:hypothetical protein OO013_08075 [Mangrovivirga sp. M17]|uniref:Uncharacterized protein n=1 Tax=Mangrovivirga halotolerans TaxID=2993936 RepID=A0ABT3RR23_9BACT|nr:hypothetical protein [Mangrovivirga halotolerans]MCX2743818.1 hypothetical protein [Mangrovivirga halotolerans]